MTKKYTYVHVEIKENFYKDLRAKLDEVSPNFGFGLSPEYLNEIMPGLMGAVKEEY